SDWPNTGNDKGATRYSTLKQINRENVKNLKVAWTYNTGDAGRGASTTIECTPIVVNGVMYITTVRSKVVALDAATGREIWKYDPLAGLPASKIYNSGGGVNRGVAFWEGAPTRPAIGGAALRAPEKVARILTATADGRLISLDARTGKLDPSFGKGGVVDLREGMEQDL